MLCRLALLATLLTPHVGSAVEPKVEAIDGRYYLDIGKEVQDALRKYDPYFQIWLEQDFIPSVRQNYKPSAAQTLAGVVGYINPDKIKDVVLLGRNRTHNLMVAALSTTNGEYQILEMDRGPLTNPRRHWIEGPKGAEPGIWMYLSYVRPGYVSSQVEKRAILLKTDAIRQNYFAGGSVIYFLKDGQFQKYTSNE